MTAPVNIKRGDLHLAVSRAFTLGRYVLMTGGGDGQPVEITIDLRERPDDLFGAEPDFVTLDAATDDHGPAIPAQTLAGDHVVTSHSSAFTIYEFALQDIPERPLYAEAGVHITLSNAELCDAPDQDSALAADWVHVYDRVTRERRTLKRPEPDAVLTGLRDVAADLQKGPIPFVYGKPSGGAVGDYIIEPTPLPPVGPLTSVEGLKAGDVLRVIHQTTDCLPEGFLSTFVRPDDEGEADYFHCLDNNGNERNRRRHDFAFVGRPDADGWMTWAGGENPVPGAVVDVRTSGKGEFTGKADNMDWHDMGESGHQIVAFRIVDTLPVV